MSGNRFITTKNIIKGEFATNNSCNKKTNTDNKLGSRLHRYESYYPVTEQEASNSKNEVFKSNCKEIFKKLRGEQKDSKKSGISWCVHFLLRQFR